MSPKAYFVPFRNTPFSLATYGLAPGLWLRSRAFRVIFRSALRSSCTVPGDFRWRQLDFLPDNVLAYIVLDRVDSIGLAVSCTVSVLDDCFKKIHNHLPVLRRVGALICVVPRSRYRPTHRKFFLFGNVLLHHHHAQTYPFLQRNVLRYKKYARAFKWSLVQQPVDVYVVRPL